MWSNTFRGLEFRCVQHGDNVICHIYIFTYTYFILQCFPAWDVTGPATVSMSFQQRLKGRCYQRFLIVHAKKHVGKNTSSFIMAAHLRHHQRGPTTTFKNHTVSGFLERKAQPGKPWADFGLSLAQPDVWYEAVVAGDHMLAVLFLYDN